jgi:peptidoglycan/LPS O-acetylase OafA/YrhL
MRPQGHPVAVITRYWGPLFGTAPHLWFLPFAFLAGVLASLSVPRLMKWPGWALIGGGLVLTLASYIYVYGWGYQALDKEWITVHRIHRLARWVEEAPLTIAGIFGVAIYGKYLPQLSRIGRKKRERLALLAFGGFVLAQVAYYVYLNDLGAIFWNRVRFFANIAGAFWLIAFVAAREGKWINRLAPFGRATYFAYLSHQLILDAAKRLLTFVPGYGTLWFAFASSFGIFAVAVGLGLLVARVKLLRWLSP